MNIALWKKLPYEIRLVIYVSLLIYEKKKLKFNIVLEQLLGINNIKFYNEDILYYNNDRFIEKAFNRLSIETMLFLNSLKRLCTKTRNTTRFILLYDDEEFMRKYGNLKIFYNYNNKLEELPFDFQDVIIFYKNEIMNKVIQIQNMDLTFNIRINYNYYLSQCVQISNIKHDILSKRYFKRTYLSNTYDFKRDENHLLSELDYPRYNYLFRQICFYKKNNCKIKTLKHNLLKYDNENYYKKLWKNAPQQILDKFDNEYGIVYYNTDV